MSASPKSKLRLEWLDAIKAFALFAILLNHIVEEFGVGEWFTNPSNRWPDFATRMQNLFPHGRSLPIAVVEFLGWLSDSGPGVFILASGIALTLATSRVPDGREWFVDFFKRRLLRIMPVYMAMHFVLAAGALLVPGTTVRVDSRLFLFSLFGLRFTDTLFYFLNPSWWFIWLILQLYLVFPFLYYLLDRLGIKRFLFVTFTFTFACRLWGILYSDSLYFWMSGIFFGTRLAEFAAGMVLARVLKQRFLEGRPMPTTARVFAWALPTYLVGFACSWTYPGSIVANLLVTLGMSGLFYVIWEAVFKRVRSLAQVIIWIGVESYAVFLFHQTPLKWTRAFLEESPKWHLAAVLAVIVLSFPVAIALDRLVSWLLRLGTRLKGDPRLASVSLTVSVVVCLGLLLVEPRLQSVLWQRVFALLLGLALVVLGYAEWAVSAPEKWAGRWLRWTALAGGLMRLAAFPPNLGDVALLGGFGVSLLALMVFPLVRYRVVAGATAAALALGAFALTELYLRRYTPLALSEWGELPALQIHPTRTYSLIPNHVTRLRYNNYDYILRTNSHGLAGPEVTPERPTPDTFRVLVVGDAFSMPEGMEYEKSYPALLETHLRGRLAPRPVQVINAGVTGYGPAEEYPQMAELVPLFKPDVVIYEFFINEFEEAQLTPEERLDGIGLKGRTTGRASRILDRIQVFERLRRIRVATAERLTGKPAGYRYKNAFLQFYRTGPNSLYTPERLARVKFFLEGMNRVAQQAGASFVIYFVPAAVAVSKPNDIKYFPWDQNLADAARYDLDRPWSYLQMMAGELGIQAFDLTPYLRASPYQPVYFPESWHWNEEGHRVVAQAVTDTLVTSVLSPSPEQTHAAVRREVHFK